jgi:hypothetical protein
MQLDLLVGGDQRGAAEPGIVAPMPTKRASLFSPISGLAPAN